MVDSFRLVNVVQTHIINDISWIYILYPTNMYIAPEADTYPLRLGGHADELLGRIATVSIGDRMHSLLGLQLLDEIALQAYGPITIVHLTLCEGEMEEGRSEISKCQFTLVERAIKGH